MFCSKCGTPLADGAKFCTGCGTPVAAPAAPAPAPAPAPAVNGLRRLYFDAKGLSLFNYKFEIKDEAGQVCYKAATISESMLTYNAMLYDAYDRELIKVSQQKKMTMVAMNFDFLTPQGALITDAMQQVKMTTYDYTLGAYGIKLSGNFLKMEFDFTQNGVPIAKVSKKFLAWGDCYEIEFADPNLEQILLASVLMIQLVVAAQRSRRRRR